MNTAHTKAFVITGAQNTGKTTVIKDVINHMISSLGGHIIYQHHSIGSQTDWHGIIQCGGKNYAIMSQGDPKPYFDLPKNFNDLHTNFSGHIDIIIGASRTRGATYQWWHNNFTLVSRIYAPTSFATIIATIPIP